MNTINIDYNLETEAWPHYWERCIGSGHATLALRADWQEQIKRAHAECGFEYVRFHGWLNDDMNVCSDYLDTRHYSFF